MATVRFEANAQKKGITNIYLRFTAGVNNSFRARTELTVDPARWDNKEQGIKKRIVIKTEKEATADAALEKNLIDLKAFVLKEFKNLHGGPSSLDWLKTVVDRYNGKKDANAQTLNGFIDYYIAQAKNGIIKNKSGVKISPETIKSWQGFKINLGEYQGVYNEKRKAKRLKDKKKIKQLNIVDFEDITPAFYKDFVNYLSDEGKAPNTIGRHIKELKYFMQAALDDDEGPLHNNRDFQNKKKFKGMREEAFSVYLTAEEVDKIFREDLSKEPEYDKARDAFICLCETAQRISDYPNFDVNIQEKDGRRYILLTQKKTGNTVFIPLTVRMAAILKKYDNKLPDIPEQYINRDIKIVAERCKIDELQRWEVIQGGMKYTKSAKKFELITCHTGRRTGCTLMYLAGIPIVDIMKISGHTTQKIFLEYVKVTKEETAVRLADHPYFNQNLKIVG